MTKLTKDDVRAAERDILGPDQEARLQALRRLVTSHEEVRAEADLQADTARAGEKAIEHLRTALSKATTERDGLRLDTTVAGLNGITEKIMRAGLVNGVGMCRTMIEVAMVLADADETKGLAAALETLGRIDWAEVKVAPPRKRGGS